MAPIRAYLIKLNYLKKMYLRCIHLLATFETYIPLKHVWICKEGSLFKKKTKENSVQCSP